MIDKPKGASSRPSRRTADAQPAGGKSPARKGTGQSFAGAKRTAGAKTGSPKTGSPKAAPFKAEAAKGPAKPFAKKPDSRRFAKGGDDTRQQESAFKPRKSSAPFKKPTRSQRADTREAPVHEDAAGTRIAKLMARAGLCSRRDAEIWIAEGRVCVNGQVLTSPAVNILPKDKVTVDGEALAAAERTRLFLFHKPRGLVTTDKDPEGRETIFDFLRKNWPDGPRVISVGRLDINTEGLLLLTNDGGLARVLELPSTGWMRRYRVRANGSTDQSVLDALKAGVTVDGIDYAGIEAKLDRVQGDNVWISMSLREGKNREIKRVLEHVGLYVNRLIRLSFGPFQLADLPEGAIEEVRTRVLKDQLGPVLAEEADADFDSPAAEPQMALQAMPGGRGDKRLSRKDGREPREKTARSEREALKARDGRRGVKPAGRDDAHGSRTNRKEAPAPLEPSFKPRGPRKHISAMREIDAAHKGERKKSVETETADRKGRKVIVERHAPAVQKAFEEQPSRDGLARRGHKARASAGRTPAAIDGPFIKRGSKTTAGSKNTSVKAAGESRGRPPRSAAPKVGRDERASGRKFAPRGRDAGKRDFDAPEAAHVTEPWKDQKPAPHKGAGKRSSEGRPSARQKPTSTGKPGAPKSGGGKPRSTSPTRPRRNG